jgi:hypothetical protein
MSKRPTEIPSDAAYAKRKHVFLGIKGKVELLKDLDKWP